MKNKKIFVIMVVFVLLLSVLVGCNKKVVTIDGLEYNKEYKQVFYQDLGDEKGFVATGNTIELYDSYTFKETYLMGNNATAREGKYVMDADKSLVYIESNMSSFNKFKNEYRQYLKRNTTYTQSEIDNFIMPSVTNNSELYFYNGYLFKLSAISAAKEGDTNKPKELSEIDGIYNYAGFSIGSSAGDQRMYLKNSIIYQVKTDDFGQDMPYEVEERKIGTYRIEGDFIEITPIVAKEGNKVNPPMKYLLADIILPVKEGDESEGVGGNSVITRYDNVRIKVIVGSFYTTKSI